MTRLCFLLGEVTPGTASSPMEDRREKKVEHHIDLVVPLFGLTLFIAPLLPPGLFYFKNLMITF